MNISPIRWSALLFLLALGCASSSNVGQEGPEAMKRRPVIVAYGNCFRRNRPRQVLALGVRFHPAERVARPMRVERPAVEVPEYLQEAAVQTPRARAVPAEARVVRAEARVVRRAGSGGASTAPVSITVIGSSSAAGKNLDQPMYGGRVGGLTDAWAARYGAFLAATRPGSTVRNLAVPGYNTYHALPTGTTNPSGAPAVDPAHNITAALNPKPDAIFVAFPSLNVTVDEIIANLHVIVNAAAAVNVPVWVATT